MADMMNRDDVVRRRWEARMMHRYGRHYLASLVPQNHQFPMVMVGDPDQKIIVQVIED